MSVGAARLRWSGKGCQSPDSTVVIDFGVTSSVTNPSYLGMCSSTYGRLPTTNTEQAAAERAIDARFCRIPVKWDGSKTVSSAAGAAPNPIKPLVAMYKSWGYRCLIVIAGRSGDFQGYQTGDAANIVSELGTTGLDYSGPNEPLLDGGSAQTVIDRGIQIYNEIQSVVNGTKVWGPVHPTYSRGDITGYMDGLSATRLAGVDYHNYAMGSTYLTTSAAFDQTREYSQQITQLKADATARGIAGPVTVDELNFSWRVADGTPSAEGGFISPKTNNLINGRFFTAINTVWMASAIGHVLSSGGRAMPYATQNGALGIMVQNDNTGDTADAPDAHGAQRPNSSPMPAYWAIAMWTGGGRPDLSAQPEVQPRNFPHFYNEFYFVKPVPGDQLTEVFAVDNEAGGYNIVIINKRQYEPQALQLDLQNISAGTYDIWQTRNGPYPAQYESPVRITSDSGYQNKLSLVLPACTVTTIVLSPSA